MVQQYRIFQSLKIAPHFILFPLLKRSVSELYGFSSLNLLLQSVAKCPKSVHCIVLQVNHQKDVVDHLKKDSNRFHDEIQNAEQTIKARDDHIEMMKDDIREWICRFLGVFPFHFPSACVRNADSCQTLSVFRVIGSIMLSRKLVRTGSSRFA